MPFAAIFGAQFSAGPLDKCVMSLLVQWSRSPLPTPLVPRLAAGGVGESSSCRSTLVRSRGGAPRAPGAGDPPLCLLAVFIIGGALSIAAGYIAPHSHETAQALVLVSRLIFGVGVGGCSAAVPMCEWCAKGEGSRHRRKASSPLPAPRLPACLQTSARSRRSTSRAPSAPSTSSRSRARSSSGRSSAFPWGRRGRGAGCSACPPPSGYSSSSRRRCSSSRRVGSLRRGAARRLSPCWGGCVATGPRRRRRRRTR